MMQSRSTSLVPIPLSLLQSTSAAGGLRLTPPQLLAASVASTSVDCGTQSNGITSIECLHEYARRAGRYPKLGLFTTDMVEIAGPSPSQPSPSLPPVSTDIPFVFSTVDDSEDKLEDVENNDGEYFPTRRTTRLRRPASSARASSSRLSTELPAKRKRGKSPESAKRQKRDTSCPATPPPTTTYQTDPKTGRQFMVVPDKKGKVYYRCPDHPDLNCSNRGDMGRHLQSRDHQQPNFCCVESCGRKFTRIDALKRHVRNTNLHPKDSLVVVECKTGAKTHERCRGKRK